MKLAKTSNADLTAHGQLKLGSPSTAAKKMIFECLTSESDNESEMLNVIQCIPWNEVMCEHLRCDS